MEEKFCVNSGKNVPLPVGVKLEEFDKNETVGNLQFRELIRSLMWLATQTRPDIATGVRAVARYCVAPNEVHWKTPLRILGDVREGYE